MMTRRSRAALMKLIQKLRSDPEVRLVATSDDRFQMISGRTPTGPRIDATVIRPLISAGLLAELEPGRVGASEEAEAWLRRAGQPEMPFRAQHDVLGTTVPDGEAGKSVLTNLEESPVASLARRSGPDGLPWLAEFEVAAAERFRRDFEIGQLRPRVTANWSASISTGRRAGGGDGLADLTDMAISARRRFERAVRATGPELSGVLIDVCCFLKGLEHVERERQWPARSAKLVLRLALSSLARHYGLAATATGPASTRGAQHWGAEGYKPKIS